MAFTVQSESPPLRVETDGALRVGDSRVLLELVIRAFQDGASPETIVKSYSSLSLRDAYAVIAYYLRHPDEVDRYLAHREESAQEVRARVAGRNGDLAEIRRRLMARRQG